jgi:Glycosyl transferase family 2
MKTSVLIPSRGNLAGLTRTVESLFQKADNPEDVEVLVRVDDDDPLPYNSLAESGLVKIIRAPSFGYAAQEYYNECFARSTGDLIWPLNDDVIIESQGWDRAFSAALEKIPYGVAGCNVVGDYYQWCFPMLRREVCDAQGCFCLSPESYDRVYDSYGRQTGFAATANVTISHPYIPPVFGSLRQQKRDYAYTHFTEMSLLWDSEAKKISQIVLDRMAKP